MSFLSGYDAWLTREPPERSEDLRWFVELYNPHCGGEQEVLGPCDTEEDARAAAEAWVTKHREADNGPYKFEYDYEPPYERDLLEECTCGSTLRSRKNCVMHGIDPDSVRDATAD